MVEPFFRDLTQHRRRRGILCDVEELIKTIGEYIDRYNTTPQPLSGRQGIRHPRKGETGSQGLENGNRIAAITLA